MIRLVVLLLGVALVGCTAPPARSVPEPEAAALISSVCADYRMPCVEEQTVRTPRVDSGVVRISTAWCAHGIDLCEFALHHEAWHATMAPDVARNERLADCFATSVSSFAASRAALHWFARDHPLTYDASHGAGVQRAAIVAGCLGDPH